MCDKSSYYVFDRKGSPFMRVRAVIAVVTQHKNMIFRNTLQTQSKVKFCIKQQQFWIAASKRELRRIEGADRAYGVPSEAHDDPKCKQMGIVKLSDVNNMESARLLHVHTLYTLSSDKVNRLHGEFNWLFTNHLPLAVRTP